MFQFEWKMGLGLCVAAAGLAGPATGAPLNILALGDSITDGIGDNALDGSGYLGSGSDKADRVAYRDWLQQSFVDAGFTDYNFIGGRAHAAGSFLPDGVTPFDPENWGRSGQTGADIGNTIATGMDGGSPADVFGGEVADVILIHIGANSIGSAATAQAHLANLFDALEDEFLTGSSISSNARIFVAEIMPKASNNSDINASFDYNALIQGEIDNAARDASFRALFAPTVDMFAIDATDASLLSTLEANSAHLGDNLTQAEILALINPDLDDDTVDWVRNYNELTGAGAADSVNSDLFPVADGDQVHPTDLGYQLLAHQFYAALQADPGVTVPEPSSVVLLLAGAGLMVRRRRR